MGIEGTSVSSFKEFDDVRMIQGLHDGHLLDHSSDLSCTSTKTIQADGVHSQGGTQWWMAYGKTQLNWWTGVSPFKESSRSVLPSILPSVLPWRQWKSNFFNGPKLRTLLCNPLDGSLCLSGRRNQYANLLQSLKLKTKQTSPKRFSILKAANNLAIFSKWKGNQGRFLQFPLLFHAFLLHKSGLRSSTKT